MTTPSNVIYFNFTDHTAQDRQGIIDMLRKGDMVMVNTDEPKVYRFDSTTLQFVESEYSEGYNSWNVCSTSPVEDVLTQKIFVFFVKSKDLYYSDPKDHVNTLHLQCEDDWYNIDSGRRFPFILNNGMPFAVYNIVNHNLVVPNDWSHAEYSWEVLAEEGLREESLNQEGPWNVLNEPQTPPNQPPCSRNLEEEFDNEAQLHTELNNLLDYVSEPQESDSDIELSESDEDEESLIRRAQEVSSDSESEFEDVQGESDSESDSGSDSGSDSESDIQTDVEETSDSEYDPTDDSQSESESEEDWLDQYYDEKRQDVDGEWYTRRQFYDYYGSDEAWDNLDPNIYHQYRYDDHYGIWATKEEFYQHYGSYRVWKRMHPVKIMKRRALWDTYRWSAYLPKHLRKRFINQMYATYL